MTGRRRSRVCVHGVVQGVGFRPFVYTTAATLGLSGSVRNDSSGAIIEVEGDGAEIDDFLTRLSLHPPPLAVIESVETQDIPVVGGTGFTIADTSRSDGGRTLASPDVAMCGECAAEQRDPANRRYRHAFVNCTNCGPRFTIIASLPYDRAATTMADFAMCAECAREYTDPTDRRFHAQPVCCPNCGPTLRYRDGNGLVTDGRIGAATGTTAAARRRRARGQGHWRIPPGLRRRRRARGRRTTQTQAPRRQAVRRHGPRLDEGARRRRRRQIIGACAVRAATSDRAHATACRRARSPMRSRRTTPTSASCWPTRRCTFCCSGCRAMSPDRRRW